MSFYSKYIFPHIMDFALRQKKIDFWRRELLAGVKGDILEIGIGTGLNIAQYPHYVKKIVTVEPNTAMHHKALKRAQEKSIFLEVHTLSGDCLPFPDQSFDTVVSTFTLCTIMGVEKVLEEIARVLKPGGRFLFLEHGLSSDPQIQKWQNRLNGFQNIVGDGCHLNRNIENIIRHSPLAIKEIEQFEYSKYPRILGYFYRGCAVKNLSF